MTWGVFLSVFLCVYVVYHPTLYPSVAGGDSGELMAEACLGGVPHPPGYPLYTMLSMMASNMQVPRVYYSEASPYRMYIDFETTTAWKMNHMCCLFGAFAAALMANTINLVLERHPYKVPATLIGCGLFAFSPLVWEYSIGGEVFALNNALCALIVYLAIRLVILSEQKEGDPKEYRRYLRYGAFVAGLALSNQHSSLLLLLIVIPMLAYRYRAQLSRELMLELIGSGFVGLSPNIYLLVASINTKPGSWGDTSNIYGFLKHVLRAEYGTFQLGFIKGSESALERIWLFIKHSSMESYHVLFPLVFCASLVRFLVPKKDLAQVNLTNRRQQRSDKPEASPGSKKGVHLFRGKKLDQYLAIPEKQEAAICPAGEEEDLSFSSEYRTIWSCVKLLGACLVGYVLIWHSVFSNLPLHAPMPYAVHSRFWMQPNMLSGILAGIGFAVAAGRLTGYAPWSKCRSVAKGSMLTVIIAAFAFVIHGRLFRINRSTDGWIMHSYGSHILRSVQDAGEMNGPPLLVSHTDLDWNSVRYIRSCERGHYGDGSDANSITHLNFQLMPYPWFKDKQAQLYPDVVFPKILPGINTARHDRNNAILISRFCDANLKNISVMESSKPSTVSRQQLFVDMQAIDDRSIGSGGIWGDFLLVSWGLVYKVVRKDTLVQSGVTHSDSLLELYRLQRDSFLGHMLHWDQIKWNSKSFGGVSDNVPLKNYRSIYNSSKLHYSRSSDIDDFTVAFRFDVGKYPPGSWEFAAASVYMDAHNQFGLALLSFAMEFPLASFRTVLGVILTLDRLKISSDILGNTLISVQALGDVLSSSTRDLEKNVATVHMRYFITLEKAVQFQSQLKNEILSWAVGTVDPKPFELLVSPDEMLKEIVTKENLEKVAHRSIEFISSFLNRYPDDKDHVTFVKVLEAMQKYSF